jgi:hypothetical protein
MVFVLLEYKQFLEKVIIGKCGFGIMARWVLLLET